MVGVNLEFLKSLGVVAIVLGEILFVIALQTLNKPHPKPTTKGGEVVKTDVKSDLYPTSPTLVNITVPSALLLKPTDTVPEWSLKHVYTTQERNVLNKVFFANPLNMHIDLPSISIKSIKKVFTGVEFLLYGLVIVLYATKFSELPLLKYLIVPILISGAFKQMAV